MARRAPLIGLIFALAAFPAACSSSGDADGDGGPSASGGGTGLDLGSDGMGGSSTTESGDGDGDSNGSLGRCTTFENLTECNSAGLTAHPVEVSILLVLDSSGSMDTPLADNAKATLWDATRTALTDALATAQASISFGLDLFPNAGPNFLAKSCEMPASGELMVPIEAGAENRQKIVSAIGSKGPGGGTPTAAALRRAFDYFTMGAGKDIGGSRFVLLATDGGPNCNEDIACEKDTCTANIDADPSDKTCGEAASNCCKGFGVGCLDDDGTLNAIAALSGVGVDTFVIGLPGSELYEEQLNKFAVEGGRPNPEGDQSYFKVESGGATAGLSDVLKKITRQLVTSCEVELEQPPTSEEFLNLAVDCEVLPRSDEEAGAGGKGGGSGTDSSWYYDKVTNRAIVLGSKCDEIESEGVERIDIIEGCPVLR